jgi:hypothetical protein
MSQRQFSTCSVSASPNTLIPACSDYRPSKLLLSQRFARFSVAQ